MSSIALPSNFSVSSFSLEQFSAIRKNSSMFGGTGQNIDLLQDRWYINLTIAPKSYSNAATIEAWLYSLRNGGNNTPFYHMARPVPRSPTTPVAQNGTTTGTNAIGSSTLNVTGMTPNGILLPGDMIGCNGLLLMVASPGITLNGSGAGAVPLVNRLRVACTAGLSVTWNMPTAPFVLAGRAAVVYTPDYAQPTQLQFVEDI